MHAYTKRFGSIAGTGVLTLALAMLLAKKINLVTADLGRHLANGKYLLDDLNVLSTNFYSHDFAATPFVNHHWLSGVVFYAVEALAGFTGLSLFYIGLVSAAFALLTWLACRQAGMLIGLTTATLVVPLIAFRNEVRPEGFSGLLVAIFLVILWRYREDPDNRRWLWTLPFLMIAWVNLHIYFVFGFILIGAFTAESAWRLWLGRRQGPDEATLTTSRSEKWRPAEHAIFRTDSKPVKTLLTVMVGTAAAALLNPFGWRLALFPLHIFDNYGYLIVENQSVWFLTNLNMRFAAFGPLYATIALLIVALLVNVVFNWRQLPLATTAVACLLAAMALLGIRNISLFGLVALPALAALWQSWEAKQRRRLATFGTLLIVAASTSHFLDESRSSALAGFGVGLAPEQLAAADFFKAQGIKGPIFNNYDIGGYLIHQLYPQVRPFVDNRPEAYPPGFLSDVYVPMQAQSAKWAEESSRYDFNAIFFYWHDLTPAAQAFLQARVRDDERAWAPVYVDDYALIFVKRTAEHATLIGRYEIPRERFISR